MSDPRERNVVVGDNIEASWKQLEDALLRRWPSEFERVMEHVVVLPDGKKFLCTYVKIDDALLKFIKELHRQSSGESKATDAKARAKRIFCELGLIFNRLTNTCDE